MPTCHHNDPALFDLADSFLHGEKSGYFWRQSAAPRLFYLWGHAYEFNNDDNWEVIEKFARLMGEREDVWKCTNVELYDYVQAFMRLEYSARKSTTKKKLLRRFVALNCNHGIIKEQPHS